MNSSRPEIAVLTTSYERPSHLRRVLASIGLQNIPSEMMEVVVTDDGSCDDTLQVVAAFAASVDFSVKVTLHTHAEFQLSRCRNEGVLVSTAPYLLFCDGDCVLPNNHLLEHLRHRRPNVVNAGDCCRLPQALSERLDISAIQLGNLEHWMPRSERERLARKHRKAQFYNLVRHPTKPKLIGNNIGIWRRDCERVNGFDEKYVGWGCEDDDFRLRLRRSGITIRSILKWTHSYHLWHPPTPSCPTKWRDGVNVRYFLDAEHRPAQCRHGLQHLAETPDEKRNRTHGAPASRPPFAEVLFRPGHGRFSGKANINVVVANFEYKVPPPLRAQADMICTVAEARVLADRLAAWSAAPRLHAA